VYNRRPHDPNRGREESEKEVDNSERKSRFAGAPKNSKKESALEGGLELGIRSFGQIEEGVL